MKKCHFCKRDVIEEKWDEHLKSHFQPAKPQQPQQKEEPVKQQPVKQQVETQSRVTTNGLHIPTLDPYFVVRTSILEFLERIEQRSQETPQNVLVTGPQGCGKTTLARQFAAKYQRPLCEIQCGLMVEPTQWFGGEKFSPDKGTYYVESLFVRAIETERAVILLDEFNRVENPKVLNSLFWLLDDRRMAWVDDLQRVIKVAKGVVFFATLNEGIQFAGVDFVDLALRDRFYTIKLDFPSEKAEEEILVKKTGIKAEYARVLARLAAIIREDTRIERKVSTRQLLLAAREITAGADIRAAIEFAIANAHENPQAIYQALQLCLPESLGRRSRNDNREVPFILT